MGDDDYHEYPITTLQTKSLNAYLEQVNRKHSEFYINLTCILKHAADEEFDQNSISKDQDTINNLAVNLICKIESLLLDIESAHIPSEEGVGAHQSIRLSIINWTSST